MEDERVKQLHALKLILKIGQGDIAARRYCDAFEFLDSLESSDSSDGCSVRTSRYTRGRRIGVAKGKFEVPDNIDQANDEIGKLFDE